MRTGITAIVCWLAFSATAMAQSNATLPPRPLPKTQQQVLQALEISHKAAENDMQQLCLRAVSDAFAGGPPTAFVPHVKRVSGATFSVYGTGLPIKKPNAINASKSLREKMRQLNVEWMARGFDSRQVYETLAQVVLPAGRPDEVFFYEQTMSTTILKTSGQLQPFSVGQLLVEWAVRANASEDLENRLKQVKASKRGQLAATVLQSMLALKLDDIAVLKERLAQLRICLLENSTGRDAEVAAQLVFPLLGHKDVSEQAASVAELVLDQILTGASTSKNYHVEPATSILKLIAETYRRSGNQLKVRETVDRLLKANTAFNNRYSGSTNNYVQRLRQAQVNTAAWIFLNADMVADAAPLLAEYYQLQSVTGRSFGFDAGLKLFRVMMAMSAQDRYELLSTITFGKENNINLSSAFVPRSIPLPIFTSAFATSLGPGNNEQRFELPAIGPTRDVLNSAALLAQTARQAGQLADLQGKLNGLDGASVINVDVIQFFLNVDAQNPDFELLKTIIDDRTTKLRLMKSDSNSLKVQLASLQDYCIAVQGLDLVEVRESAVALLEVINDASRQVQNALLRSHVQQSLNHVKLSSVGLEPGQVKSPGLQHWHVVNCDVDQSHAAGSVATTWTAQDGYIKALTAPQDGLLYFRYPLIGQFEVSAMISHGYWLEGGFVYDGMQWQNQGLPSQEALLLHIGRSIRKSPRVNLADSAAQDSLNTLQLNDSNCSYRINRHVAATDKLSGGSPFLALKASAGITPGFRHLKITGAPQIPRQVQLLSDHRLRGWAPYHSEEKLCSAFETKDPGNGDWIVKDGILRSSILPESPLSESLLMYHRPMQSGEQIAWEFQYKPDLRITHPSLGRLVFLLRPDGVRLHWLTDGESEWSGLSADHEVTDAAAQRSTQLPLLPDAWNKAKLSLTDQTVQLHLNGQLVLEREHESDLEMQFGFFHNRHTEEVAVRDAMLSGDWPATFQEAINGSLLAGKGLESSSNAEQLLAAKLITASELEQMGYQLARDVELLPAEKRYDILNKWVLPDRLQKSFRMQGGFVSGFFDAAVADSQSEAPRREPTSLVSPALDLVSVAKQLNRLDQLKQDVLATVQQPGRLSDQSFQSAQQAVLSAIATADQNFVAANQHLNAVLHLAQRRSPLEERLWWSELVAAWNAIQFPETITHGIRILDHLIVERLNNGGAVGGKVASLVQSMQGLAHYRHDVSTGKSKPLPDDGLWKPVTRVRSDTSASGMGDARWAVRADGTVVHHSGHQEDFLYYDVPLRGDFVVTCELVPDRRQEARIMYADHWLGINSSGKRYEHGRVGFTMRSEEFAKTAMPLGKTYQLRMEVKSGVHTHWVNGTKIHEEKLAALPDPWLAIRCGMTTENSPIRNLKITGSPQIPYELHLTHQANLEGWTARHFGQLMRYSGGDWGRSGHYIIGAKRTDQKTTMRESLLQYHRPMLEDGELEYTFAYSDTQRVHPAIGRTVFLLNADGVQEHIITNGIYGLASPRPDNQAIVPANQLTTTLPLTRTNKLKLKLRGDEVSLVLNGVAIYQKTLGNQDQRFFGLFHYPGQSEAKVSNVVYQGDWAKKMPVRPDGSIAP